MTDELSTNRKTFDPSLFIREVSYTNSKTGEITVRHILDTAPRLAWFRVEHPIETGWCIVTEPVTIDDTKALFRAQLISPEGKVVASAFRQVFKTSFQNYIEKAETQAVGRLMERAGYGCTYALSLEPDEGEDDSDSAGGDVSTKGKQPPEPQKDLSRIPGVTKGALARIPAAVKDDLHKKAAAHKKSGEPSTDKQKQLLAILMNEALEAKEDGPRHLCMSWLWDYASGSSDELKFGMAASMLDWLVAKDKDGSMKTPDGKYVLSPVSKSELRGIYRQAQMDAGQAELPITKADLYGEEDSARRDRESRGGEPKP